MSTNAKQVAILKQLQADSLVFFMKVHNFHWNVKGKDFPQTHKVTEEIYTIFSNIFDDLAERIAQLGDTPLVTLTEILKTAQIKEDSNTSFRSESVMKNILADYQYFLETFRKLSEIANATQDIATQAYADSQISFLEKSVWMLNAQLA
ncbi:DNA starvation/stationary phase protection protein [Helicobacter aurati]|uniref:DNA starvation/stationary phase protection protein n=1 Tax=Helicobacter aurati TaxID=137778 RepID=A0A3D8J9F3_9HELI|nr:DNA starvation/stationary phase protection protein [Helicobacter aurati]RDU73795.1 DNA starvation/stationary phase protection protein [Helicobacter aurati]